MCLRLDTPLCLKFTGAITVDTTKSLVVSALTALVTKCAFVDSYKYVTLFYARTWNT